MPELLKVGVTDEIPEGEGKAYTAGKHKVAIFNVGGSFYAINDACPHAGGPLSDGWMEGMEVTCPWHGWTFDVRPDAPPTDGLCRYKVQVNGNELFVEIPD